MGEHRLLAPRKQVSGLDIATRALAGNNTAPDARHDVDRGGSVTRRALVVVIAAGAIVQVPFAAIALVAAR